jgi:predicted transglutaminase-like cysteine proteinase
MRSDPARAFPPPRPPACRPVRWAAGGLRQRVRYLTAAALRRAVAGVAACAALAAGHAWDAERMAAAARQLGPLAVQGAQALRPLLEQAGTMDEPARVEAFNLFYNRRIQFRDDAEIWGQKDYWASPLETLGRGAGDCEDYAIAKYFSLVAAGIPARKLRLVYVRAQLGGPGGVVQPHMVLAYYPAADAEPMILDNLVTEVRPASRRPDLTPLFSFNAEGLWQGVSGAAGGDAASRLSRWREVLVKARAEGFQGEERP